MKSQQKINLVFSIIIIGLIATILVVSLSESKTVNEQSVLHKSEGYQLMEFKQEAPLSLNGIITASQLEDVKMSISGKVDKGNRILKAGSSFKKNEVLIKVERLEALYELLSARSEFKEKIQKLTLTIQEKVPGETGKWKAFEEKIQRTLPLPALPAIKSKAEEELLNGFGIYTHFYQTKKIERKAEEYIYLAPFDGTIIESNISPGSMVHSGEVILKLAKNNSYQLLTHVALKNLDRIKTKDTLHFKSLEGNMLTKGVFSKVGSALSDSSTVEVYYTIDKIDSQKQKHLNTPVHTSLTNKLTNIPTSAIQNDSVTLYAAKTSFKLAIEIMSSTGDSSIVNGLPSHCFIITNP